MSTKKQLSYIQNVVEDLINENAESSQINFRAYLQEKTREIILGEACDDEDKDKDDEDNDDEDNDDEDGKKVAESFTQPTKVSKIKYKSGGKKTAKVLDKQPTVTKIQYKKSGKKTATKFSDGRDYGLGTT